MKSNNRKSEQYIMKVGGIERNILRMLNVQRTKYGTAQCDVELIARETKFYAHKFVLCSCSDYFSRCLNDRNQWEFTTDLDRRRTEKNLDISDKSNRYETDNSHSEISIENDELKMSGCSENHGILKKERDEISLNTKHESKFDKGLARIYLPGIAPTALGQILDCLYTSQLVLHSESINDILLTSCLLQVNSVIEACADLLLKQPNWRSSLVSPLISHYAKNKTNVMRKNERLRKRSPTAVTWMAGGARTSSHEMDLKKGNKLDLTIDSSACTVKNSPKQGDQANRACCSRRKKALSEKQQTPSLDCLRNDGANRGKDSICPRNVVVSRKRRNDYLKDAKFGLFDFPSDRNVPVPTSKDNLIRKGTFCGSEPGIHRDHYQSPNTINADAEVMQISQEGKEKYAGESAPKHVEETMKQESSYYYNFPVEIKSASKMPLYTSKAKIPQSSSPLCHVKLDWKLHEPKILKAYECTLDFARHPSVEKRPRRDSWAVDHSKAPYFHREASSLHSRRIRCVSDGVDSLTKHFTDVKSTYSTDGKLICISPIAMNSLTAPTALNYRLAPTISQQALAYPGQQVLRSQCIPGIGVFPRDIRNTTLKDIEKKSCSSPRSAIPLYSHMPIASVSSQSVPNSNKVSVPDMKLGRYAGSLMAIYSDPNFHQDFHLTNEAMFPSYPYVVPLYESCNPTLYSKPVQQASLPALRKGDIANTNSENPPPRYVDTRKYSDAYNRQFDSLIQSSCETTGNSSLDSFFGTLPTDRLGSVNISHFSAQKNTTTELHNSLLSPPLVTNANAQKQDIIYQPQSPATTFHEQYIIRDNKTIETENDVSFMESKLDGENERKRSTAFTSTYTDHHHIKRKLLSAAENIIPRKTNKSDLKNHSVKPDRTPGVFSKTLKTKYSSEDEVIARECNNHYSVVSEAESDDSGRPSSV